MKSPVFEAAIRLKWRTKNEEPVSYNLTCLASVTL